MSQHSSGTGRFDNGFYKATKTAFIETGMPAEIAEKAAAIIARDDINEPNLGRSKEDQDFVWQAWHYIVLYLKEKE